ncbi:hypothetical protein Tco_1293663 [Tanacetum coccineum]
MASQRLLRLEAHLANYDNDNEIENDDLGYHSKEYFDDAHEEYENNHSNGNVVKRGIIRISGKHKALFSSFLGDMVCEHIGLKILAWNKVGSEARYKLWDEITRYFDVDLTVRKQVKSVAGRVNKDGEYQDDEIRKVGDKLKETEDKIKEGTLQVDQGTDAMTLKLGKEKGGYARGVGSGVTYKRYFDLPRSKQAADERILLLESQLDAARREREEKELLIKSMSSKMSQTEGMVTKLKNQLAAQGGQSQSTPTQLTPLDVSLVDIHPVNSSADEEGGTTETVKYVGAKRTTRSIRKDSSSQDSQSKENVSVLPQAIKCRQWHLKKTNIIAEGTVYKSDGKIMLHNKALSKDSYKVSIDKSRMNAAL